MNDDKPGRICIQGASMCSSYIEKYPPGFSNLQEKDTVWPITIGINQDGFVFKAHQCVAFTSRNMNLDSLTYNKTVVYANLGLDFPSSPYYICPCPWHSAYAIQGLAIELSNAFQYNRGLGHY